MQEEVKEQVLEEVKTEKSYFLVIHNDDVNSFEYVIFLLVKVCGLDITQAEKCTFTIHYSGKCEVKEGEKKELIKLKDILMKRGLTVTVE